jgi:phosphopantothenate-cysteine ligase
MTAIVTAGGTIERIDNIRGITNFATGRLGALTADELALRGARVIFVHGLASARTRSEKIECHAVGSVAELDAALEGICKSERVDVIIHSMAVSDYTVADVTDGAGVSVMSGGKISSEYDELFIRLKRTPKIIARLRELAPKAKLVGFKLLSEVTLPELFERAGEVLVKNDCEYVLANRMEDIGEGLHRAYLIDRSGVAAEYDDKQQIAKGLAEKCLALFSE